MAYKVVKRLFRRTISRGGGKKRVIRGVMRCGTTSIQGWWKEEDMGV
jgi:hypothetical protein